MREKKPKTKRAKGYAKLSQKEKFIAAAKEFEADETGKTFLETFKTIVKQSRTVDDGHQTGKKRSK